MMVVGHGNVEEFCRNHDMTVCWYYNGELVNYDYVHPVIVTDRITDANEYYYVKYRLMKRGVTLISAVDFDTNYENFIEYMSSRDKVCKRDRYKRVGRAAFGFKKHNGKQTPIPEGIAMAQKIIRMKDAGYKYREIIEDEGVHYPDGRKIGISTIQVILRNRRKYEAF